MKSACPKCQEKGKDRSRDNLEIYPDGSSHCFACGYTVPSERYKKGGQAVEREKRPTKPISPKEATQLWENTACDETGFRGIRKEINKLLQIRTDYNGETGEVNNRYYPARVKGKVTGFNVRYNNQIKRTFLANKGYAGTDCDFFGEHLVTGKHKYCLLVGGQEDVAAATQMLRDYHYSSKAKDFPPPIVLSALCGEKNTANFIRNRYDIFESFEYIVLGLDNDEDGINATKAAAEVLPLGKVKIAKWRLNDPNDYIKDEDRSKDFIQDFYAADEYRPDNIVCSNVLMQAMVERAEMDFISLPPFANQMEDMFAGGFPMGTLITIGAGTGIGKTTIVNEFTRHWILNEKYRSCILSLESDAAEYATNLLSSYAGVKIGAIKDKQERVGILNRPDVLAKYNRLFGEEESRFTLIDHQGSLKGDAIKEKMEYCRVVYGDRIFVIDPLTLGLAGSTKEETDEIGSWMIDYANRHKVTIVNVCHLRKNITRGKSLAEGGEPSEEDIMGPSSIIQNSKGIILLWRNKEADCEIERNTVHTKVSKNRWADRTGKSGDWMYNRDTHQMSELRVEEDY